MEPQRLSRISTQWSLLRQAHAGPADEAAAARGALMDRYCGAAYRYLLGAVRDEDRAAELFQEFALRFLRGDFWRADPSRGRFRDYVRVVLINLVNDLRSDRFAQHQPLPDDFPAPTESGGPDDPLDQSWAEELLDHTWTALERAHPHFHAVLLARVERPDATAAELAAALETAGFGHHDAAWARVALHRARARFAHLLIEETRLTLDDPSDASTRDELERLGLLSYCGDALRPGIGKP